MHTQARGDTDIPSHGPLAGIRVIDFTTAWAGPMATRTLAFLGAHVVKIDAPSHLDAWRGALAGGAHHHYPDRTAGDRPYNRNLLFNTQGHDKWSLGLDLKAEGGTEVLTRLARVSDVVVANFTPRVLDRLGAGYEALTGVNPRIIVVEMPAFGASGPMAHHQGMGNTMEAASGMAGLMGYGDGAPVLTGPAYLDPVGGLNAAAAALMALQVRERTGRGCRIEVPQIEASAHWIGEYLLEQVETGDTWHAHGNRVPDAAPHDAYPARGNDEWVAIAVCDDAQWRALCAVLGDGDRADAPRFAAATDRWLHQDDLYEAISAWTSTRGKYEAAATLQDHGVPAAPVCHGGDLADDPGLRAAGFLTALDHPEAGRHEYPGLAYRLERTPGEMRQAAPCFGQHNDAVLRDVLGLDDEQVAALRREGTVRDAPTADAQTARRNRSAARGAVVSS